MAQISTIVDDMPNISVISKMEALGFNFSSEKDKKLMETFIEYSNLLNINEQVINKTIEIKKSKKIKLPDAIIASTALINNYSLATRNITDFKGIDGLNLFNPYDL